MGRRLLLLLSQNPLDPAGGAARTIDSICRLLATHGYQVEALGTDATDFQNDHHRPDVRQDLQTAGIEAKSVTENGIPVIQAERDGVKYTILETAGWRVHRPHPVHAPRFEKLYHAILDRLKPEIVLTFGASSAERQRQREARRRGAAVVLSVQQHGYYDLRAFHTVDAVLTCSEFLRKCYIDRIGVDSVAIESPLILDDVVAADHDPVFVTFVNPSIEKGVYFFARLAEELGVHRPDIPLLVVESRGTVGTLVSAGDDGGFDLRRHESLMISPGVARPRDIYQPTRIVLVPSVWAEPWGRVAAEALLNGIPPIVSDRGGLSEACGGAGFMLPLPNDLTESTRIPPPAAAVQDWFELITKLCDDESAYTAASAQALAASKAFHPDSLVERYLKFFDSVRIDSAKAV